MFININVNFQINVEEEEAKMEHLQKLICIQKQVIDKLDKIVSLFIY